MWWFRVKGWKMVNDVPPDLKQYVIMAAPHTSNWDFIYALGCFHTIGLPIRFTIKEEWLRWPFKGFMQSIGALGINRAPKEDGSRPSQTEAMVQLFTNHPELAMLVTPEGSRSKRDRWKTGFYHVAQQANVPILLGYMDYPKREAGVTALFYPTGDIEADLKKVMEFYDKITPRFPEKYSPDTRFV